MTATMTAPDLAAVLAALLADRRALVPLLALADRLECDYAMVSKLASEGVERGMWERSGLNGSAALCLTPSSAAALELRLNHTSTRWLTRGEPDKAARQDRRRGSDRRTVRECDGFNLGQLPDPAGWSPDLTTRPPAQLVGLGPVWTRAIIGFDPSRGSCPVCHGEQLARETVCLVCHATQADPRPRPMVDQGRLAQAQHHDQVDGEKRERRRERNRELARQIRSGRVPRKYWRRGNRAGRTNSRGVQNPRKPA